MTKVSGKVGLKTATEKNDAGNEEMRQKPLFSSSVFPNAKWH